MIHTEVPPVQHVAGMLHLGFTCQPTGGQTRLTICEQRPPLKVIRAFPLSNGGTLVHLHNISGGVLGGDQLTLSFDIGPAASAQITSTSATRLYRCRPGMPPAVQTTTIRVAPDALFEYLPDPLIPFAGSRYRQQTQIDLAPGAGLFYWETIAPGRTAGGELFAYDLLQLGLTISAAGKPIAREHLKLEPAQRPLPSSVRLGAYRYLTSFYICKVGLPTSFWSQLEQELNALAQHLSRPGAICWGASCVLAHGLVVRAVSREGHELPSGLFAFWQAASMALYERNALPPRKLY